jgi:hypothetical protein
MGPPADAASSDEDPIVTHRTVGARVVPESADSGNKNKDKPSAGGGGDYYQDNQDPLRAQEGCVRQFRIDP